jgi:hypothetical protein
MVSLIVMVLVVTQQAKAELSMKDKLLVNYIVQRITQDLKDCNMVLDNQVKLNSTNSNLTKAQYLSNCDKALTITVSDWCHNLNEKSTKFIESGLCDDPGLSKYIYERNLLDKIK